jgi:hypothetical protein
VQEKNKVVHLQKSVPFVDARSPERDCERKTQDELGKRWRRNRANDDIQPFKEIANPLPSTASGNAHFCSHRH